MTYIHKYRIQRRHDLLHTTVVDIAYGKIILIPLLASHFLQSVILCQRYRDFCRLYVNNQFAFHSD